jgi:hypothetical protein
VWGKAVAVSRLEPRQRSSGGWWPTNRPPLATCNAVQEGLPNRLEWETIKLLLVTGRGQASAKLAEIFNTADRFSSGRLRDLDIASNAAGDIVEIRSALVEIR